MNSMDEFNHQFYNVKKEKRSEKNCVYSTERQKRWKMGTCLVAQWLRLHVTNPEFPGSILGQRTRSHMATRSSHATTKGPNTAK